MLLPLSVLGGVANGYAATCLSALLVSRTPEHERGRVSAAANAVFGGAQGISLLTGGAVAAVLSPRDVYAVAGLLGVAAAVAVGIVDASRTSGRLRTESPDPVSALTAGQATPAPLRRPDRAPTLTARVAFTGVPSGRRPPDLGAAPESDPAHDREGMSKPPGRWSRHDLVGHLRLDNGLVRATGWPAVCTGQDGEG